MDEMLTAASHYAVVHYRTTTTQGTSTNYDTFFGEAIDGRDPDGYTGTSSTTPDQVTITGMAHTDLMGMGLSQDEAVQLLPIGQFQPGDIVFECKQSEYASSVWVNVNKVVYDGDDYRIHGLYKRGLLEQDFLWSLFLRKTDR